MEEKSSLYDEFDFLEEDDDYIDENGVSLYDWCMTNDEYGKQILSEWSDRNTGNFNEPLSTRDVYCKDTQKYWWKCSFCSSDYYSQLFKRLYNHRGCPSCAGIRGGKKRTENAAKNGESIKEYCQYAISGHQILNEWNADRNLKEFGFTVDNVSYASNKDAWWICSNCNKSYKKMIYIRTKMNQSCPDCGRAGTSVAEQFIYWSLKQVENNTIHRGRFFGGYEYDIFVEKWNLYIEYNGSYWHKGKEERDLLKRDLCLNNGGKFLSICVSKEYENDIFTPGLIQLREVSADFEKKLQKVVDYIVNQNRTGTYEIDFVKAYDDAISHIYTEVENSVAKSYPMLRREFDEEKNSKYRLEALTQGSNVKIKWKCSSCNHIWETRMADRISRKSGCPRCKYNVFKVFE